MSEPCAHTKLDFCGMIRFFVVSFTVVILNAALAVLSVKGQCVCVCGGGGGGGGIVRSKVAWCLGLSQLTATC